MVPLVPRDGRDELQHPEIIEIINERYVPVRVDNDERPDVNRRYNMGGWPSTVFLTPEGEIIHGGRTSRPTRCGRR